MSDLVNLAKERTETRYGGDWLDTVLDPHTRVPGLEQQEWTLVFGWAKNPIPMNGSRHGHRAHARLVRNVKFITAREARFAGIPALEHCEVALTWYVLTAARRDPVNLSATLKAMQDGLVHADVVRDDTPDLMNTVMPAIIRVDKMRHREAWMELVVRRWKGPDA